MKGKLYSIDTQFAFNSIITHQYKQYEHASCFSIWFMQFIKKITKK